MAAYIIDVLIFGGFNFLLMKVVNGTVQLGPLPLIVPFLYFWISTALYRKSIGKKIFGLEVISSDNSKMTWGKAFLREVVGRLISWLIFGLGYIWILFDKKRQGWHDKIAGTYVTQISPLNGGKKVLAYILVFTFPGLVILSLVLAILFVAINPAAQIQKAKEIQRQQILQQQYNQQIQQ